tara:strand:+ start:387 stop:1526 length:1140 start_codon:yes stop_codon:yes gene_type:complete
MKYLYIIFFLFLTFNKSLSLDTKATHAVILDYDTNEIIFDKNGSEKTSPASMTKILTTYIVFDKIKKNNLSLEDKFKVSSKAYKKGGSRMFIEINSLVSVKDLLYGVIVQSGNDASIALAENISGSEEAFAKLMNEYAKELGMDNSNFINSSGWPDPKHYSSMKDLAILSKAIINDFPKLYKIYKEKKFTYNNIMQLNRNSLLKYYPGVDGLKTGYVKDSGYGIIVSSLKDKRRIIVAINGLESQKTRIEESEKLLNWAYRETKHYEILTKDQVMTSTDVWLGKNSTVDLISPKSIIKTLTHEEKENLTIKLKYDKPINAPIEANQIVGNINIIIPKKNQKIEIPLIAKNDVKRVNPLIRVFVALKYLIFGNISNEKTN